MITPADFLRIDEWLGRTQRPLIATHRRPDGDALGAVAALARILHAQGATPVAVLFEPFPPRYGFLEPLAGWADWHEIGGRLREECDALIILDTCAEAQLEPLADFLPAAPPTLVLDHHETRDPIGTRPGDLQIIDSRASACCLLVAEWIFAGARQIGPDAASGLFTGIATDTGWFRFSNSDARTLRAAARLIELGAAPSELYDRLYQQDSAARLRLVGRMLERLEVCAGGQLALLQLRNDDYGATGADRNVGEDLVNEAARLRGSEVTILLTEETNGEVRINFRSKRRVDVSRLAVEFGGGGHARAAGARARGEFEHVRQKVVAAAERAIAAASAD